jgi:MFS family permease
MATTDIKQPPPEISAQDIESAQTATAETEWKPSTQELLIMLSLATVSLMISLDASIIITSLTRIITDLHGTAIGGFWVGTSYLLTCAVCMPFIASLSDIFGRPICLLSSLATFTIGTIVCCLSHKLSTLIVGRCVQGIGGGGIVILSLIIFTDIVPLRFRSKWYGIIQGGWALGSLLGPVIGGAFAQGTTWRWVFYIMLPFCFIGFATIPWVLTLKAKTDTLQAKLKRVDWFGGALFISSMTSFLIAISWGGTQEPWASFRTIVPLTLGALGLILTTLWEAYRAKEPFLRRSLFYCPSAFAAYFGAFIQGLLVSTTPTFSQEHH